MANYSIDLIKQMAVCDANYIRLLKLLPPLQAYLDDSYAEYVTEPKAVLAAQPEPAKCLEGSFREFAIADLGDGQDKVMVKITILEAFKYTTTLEITQRPQFEQWMTNPSMLVRAYHDAKTAEVTSYQGHRNFRPRYTQPNSKMYHADEKMQVNAFLGEWLTHCLQVGRSSKAPDLIFNK